MIIDRGKDHGLAVGQFVMSPAARRVDQSVIGTISGVDAKTAKVRLITAPYDPKAPDDPRIAVSIGNLSFRAFMEGRGGNTARIQLAPTDTTKTTKASRQQGDPVYVQKLPGLDVPVIAATGHALREWIRTTRCSGTSRSSPSATSPACARWPSWSPPSRPNDGPPGPWGNRVVFPWSG